MGRKKKNFDTRLYTAGKTKEKIEECPKCKQKIKLVETDEKAEKIMKDGEIEENIKVLAERNLLVCPKCNVTFIHKTECSICGTEKISRMGLSFCPNGHYRIVSGKRVILQPISGGLYNITPKWINIDK